MADITLQEYLPQKLVVIYPRQNYLQPGMDIAIQEPLLMLQFQRAPLQINTYF
jgi:hypothetical protein